MSLVLGWLFFTSPLVPRIAFTTTKWAFIILIPGNEFWTVLNQCGCGTIPSIESHNNSQIAISHAPANYTSTFRALLNPSEKDGMVFIVICFQKPL